MDKASARATRLIQIQRLLLNSKTGLTARELAQRCQVSVRTIQRDLLMLQTDLHVPITEDHHKYRILDTYFLPPVSLSLQEARALFIAGRLFMRYSDEADPHGVSALRRLASVLPDPIAQHVERMLVQLEGKPSRLQFARVLETITSGWAKGRCVRIRYQTAQRPEERETVLEPYFLEASGAGYATYVIGFSQAHSEVRTFKVERITSADLTDQDFQVPQDFDPHALLRGSWGVIWREEEIEVRIRFSPRVARRVQESIWHPSQQLEPLEDGGCLCVLRVPSLMEITPWVRGWGPDAEVLAPPEFRELIAKDAVQAAALYTASEGND